MRSPSGRLSGAIGAAETLVLAATLNTVAAVVVPSVPAVRSLRAYPPGFGSSR